MSRSDKETPYRSQTPCVVFEDRASDDGEEEGPVKRFVHRIDEEAVVARIAMSQALLSRRPSTSASPTEMERQASLPPLPPALQPPLSDAGSEQHRPFSRGDVDEEEVTPPISRSRSPDVLSVAHILAGSSEPSVEPSAKPSAEPSAEPPGLNRSPSIVAAATALLGATGSGTRRRLEVLSESSPCPKRSRQSADGAEQQPPTLWVGAIGKNVSIRSGATPYQLKLLSAAFQLCPQPTSEQLLRLASHMSVAPQELDTWFQRRWALQEWAQAPGAHLQPATVARLFYAEAE